MPASDFFFRSYSTIYAYLGPVRILSAPQLQLPERRERQHNCREPLLELSSSRGAELRDWRASEQAVSNQVRNTDGRAPYLKKPSPLFPNRVHVVLHQSVPPLLPRRLTPAQSTDSALAQLKLGETKHNQHLFFSSLS